MKIEESKEKVIKKYKDGSVITGYMDEDEEFTINSFNDEPAIILKNGTKYWYKDNEPHRDNNLPVVIWPDGDIEYYKNDKRYWIINNEEYYDIDDVYEKFKNKILKLNNVNTNILKENNIDAIFLYDYYYYIMDQDQYMLAVKYYNISQHT